MGRRVFWIGAALLLGACGRDGLEGTYRNQTGLSQYRFSRDGLVEITSMGVSATAEYQQKDDHIILYAAHGTLVLKRRGTTLEGPLGLHLVPVSGSGGGDDDNDDKGGKDQ